MYEKRFCFATKAGNTERKRNNLTEFRIKQAHNQTSGTGRNRSYDAKARTIKEIRRTKLTKVKSEHNRTVTI